MKKIILTFIATLCCTVMANAENPDATKVEYEKDKYMYFILNNDDKTATVTWGGEYYYSGTDEYTGNIQIPATVTYNDTEYCVNNIGDYAFYSYNKNGITGALTLPSTVTSIGIYAFAYCDKLTSISLPKELKSIKNYAFYNSGISGVITIPSTVTEIGSDAFSYCKDLSSVSLPEGLQSIGNYAFCSCGITGSLTIPSTVTEIGSNAFSYCKDLSSVSLPEGLQSIGIYAFFSCGITGSLTIPSTVTSLESHAFDGTKIDEVLVYSDNLTSEITDVWSKTIPTYVTGKSYDKYRTGIFMGYNVKLFSDADNISDLMKYLLDFSDEKADAVKSFLKVLDTMGTKQDGPAVIVTDKDGTEIKLYMPKSVEFIKVKE